MKITVLFRLYKGDDASSLLVYANAEEHRMTQVGEVISVDITEHSGSTTVGTLLFNLMYHLPDSHGDTGEHWNALYQGIFLQGARDEHFHAAAAIEASVIEEDGLGAVIRGIPDDPTVRQAFAQLLTGIYGAGRQAAKDHPTVTTWE